MDVGPFRPGLSTLHLLKSQLALRSIAYWFRRCFGDSARIVAAEHFLDGRDARPALVLVFDRGMCVAGAAKRGDAIKNGVRLASFIWLALVFYE
jgi:hypothetical protein